MCKDGWMGNNSSGASSATASTNDGWGTQAHPEGWVGDCLRLDTIIKLIVRLIVVGCLTWTGLTVSAFA